VDPDFLASQLERGKSSDDFDDAARIADRELLRDLLARLPAPQRRALVLATYFGRTAKEISELDDTPVGTVKTRIRDALIRHVEKDLGPLSMPRIPLSPQPFTVAEYFPTPGVTPFHDPRQHAVALAFVVPVMGDCSPQQNALDLAWVTPDEAGALAALGEMDGGHGVLLRQALAHVGHPV